MKYLLQLILFCFCTTLLAQEIEKGGHIDMAIEYVKTHKIKSITQEFKCGFEEENGNYTFYYYEEKVTEKYNKEGNVISTKIYDNEGTLTDTSVYEFDKSNNLLISYTNKSDLYDTKKTYQYSNFKYLITVEEFEKGNLKHRYSFTNEMFGKVAIRYHRNYKESAKEYGSSQPATTLYKYDEYKQLVSETDYDEYKEAYDTTIYEYSNNRRTVTTKKKNYDDQLIIKHVITHDSNGNKTEEVFYNYKGELEGRHHYIYDTNNILLTYEVYNENDNLDKIHTYTYDTKNNVIREVLSSPKNATRSEETTRVTKYIYEYDRKGNWTLRITYPDKNLYDDEPIADKRTIKYYK